MSLLSYIIDYLSRKKTKETPLNGVVNLRKSPEMSCLDISFAKYVGSRKFVCLAVDELDIATDEAFKKQIDGNNGFFTRMHLGSATEEISNANHRQKVI